VIEGSEQQEEEVVEGSEQQEEEVVEDYEEQEEELFETEFQGVKYYTSNTETGILYQILEDESPGDPMGQFIQGGVSVKWY